MNNSESNYLMIIETFMVILIIGILFASSLPIYQDYMERAKNSELILSGSDLRVKATVNYTINGSWEESFENNEDKSGYTGASYWKNNATIIVEKSTSRINNEEQLSFQGFIQKDEKNSETGIILWLCGYKIHPMIDSTKIKHQTTIPAKQLPFACR